MEGIVQCRTTKQKGGCPLWVKSGHVRCSSLCPLCPQQRLRKRTFANRRSPRPVGTIIKPCLLCPRKRTRAVQLAMSAKGHKRTLRQAQPRSALPPPKAPTAKIESLMFSTHWQCRYLNAAFVRIIGNVKAELNAHGKHHRVFAQHLAPYAL